ncbi:IpaD/SipD/SspD family type III secretion system needle tip protein [Erwinia pyrifoliae]|uniref:IpaD/SipD/SspD family type III secretion system needle tip protein n=1 Tax=Erwinia pyrifoliae TaxID=79967 RepID=UPI00223AC988|nr:IpaD/SipD/SspD family type III secretion system needle tip protein [Erwinia pyrifoliae]MCT2387382.1 IpaD/SipD/SspD family type III secretion system needle tip protein [Erwinia pyrifoliae]MCU8587018.1 IpaD/SipD/SspD family type III secretion system needle tip protein [Erwinia pyrifoliae]
MSEITSLGDQTIAVTAGTFPSNAQVGQAYSRSLEVPSFETQIIDNEYVRYEINKKLLLRLSNILTSERCKDKLSEVRQFLKEEDMLDDSGDFDEINDIICGLQDSYENISKSNKNADVDINDQEKLTGINERYIQKTYNHIRKSSILLDTSTVESSLQLELAKDGASANVVEVLANEEITPGTSYAELWSKIAKAIASIKEDYVDFYASLMKQYTDLYQSYNENVQKASSDAMSTGEDGNNISFDQEKMENGYKKFKEYLADADPGVVKNWDNMSTQDQESMRLALAPAFDISVDGKISFNLSQYATVDGSLPKGEGNKVPTVNYHAWLATFNTAGSALQSNMQSFAQRYSQSNSTFDQLNKVLSGVISTLGDSARDVFKGLG